MTTSYPGAIDNLTNPTPSDPLNSATVPHAAQHANANDAIEAIQTELGVMPSGSFPDVHARLNAMNTDINTLIQETGNLAVDVVVLQSDVDYRVKGYTSSNQPASPQPGDLWVDPDDSSIKVWNGSAFVNPSNAGDGTGLPWAVVSGGTVTEYTHPTYGVMSVHTFAGNGTLTVSTAGFADVLVLSGGGYSTGAAPGNGGRVADGFRNLPAGSLPVTVGGPREPSSVGTAVTAGPSGASSDNNNDTGAGGTLANLELGYTSSVNGTATDYGRSNQNPPRANRGDGPNAGGTTPSAGVVIVAVKKP